MNKWQQEVYKSFWKGNLDTLAFSTFGHVSHDRVDFKHILPRRGYQYIYNYYTPVQKFISK